jgi:hypothetical protein
MDSETLQPSPQIGRYYTYPQIKVPQYGQFWPKREPRGSENGRGGEGPLAKATLLRGVLSFQQGSRFGQTLFYGGVKPSEKALWNACREGSPLRIRNRDGCGEIAGWLSRQLPFRGTPPGQRYNRQGARLRLARSKGAAEIGPVAISQLVFAAFLIAMPGTSPIDSHPTTGPIKHAHLRTLATPAP